MIGVQPAGVGAEGGQDQPHGVGEEARPGHGRRRAPAAAAWGGSGPRPRRRPPRRRAACRKASGPSRQLAQVAAAERQRARVVVAGDPDPVAAGHQRGEPRGVGLGQRRAGRAVVEAVAEADDGGGRQLGDLAGQPVQGLGGLVGRQQRAAAPGQPLGLAEVQVGDAEQPLGRPPERAGGAGGQDGAGEDDRDRSWSRNAAARWRRKGDARANAGSLLARPPRSIVPVRQREGRSVMSVYKAFEAAMRDRDTDAFIGLLADNFQFVRHQTGRPWTSRPWPR